MHILPESGKSPGSVRLWRDLIYYRAIKVFRSIIVKLFAVILVPFVVILAFRNEPVSAPRAYAQSTPASMAEYWNGSAYFNYQTQFLFPTTPGTRQFVDMNLGLDLVVRGNTWFLFHREYFPAPNPSRCKFDSARIVGVKSVDKGKTWTGRTVLMEPYTSSPGSLLECAVIDGDAYYDEPSNTWHNLTQCLSANQVWSVCHATRTGADPLGPFTMDPANPVIRNDGNLTHDVPRIVLGNNTAYHDAGTPDIVQKIGDYYYITFHVYDYSKYAMRIAAKTKDFKNWERANTATGPIFDRSDCAKWVTVDFNAAGCIGAGLSSTLVDSDYYYTAIEAPTVNLACVPGQEWDYGLVRSNNLVNHTWSAYQDGRSPFFLSTKELDRSTGIPESGKTPLCGTQYVRLFKDSDGSVYFMGARIGQLYGNASRWADSLTSVYLYKLERGVPFASYRFREGPFQYNGMTVSHNYTQSDVLVPGRMEANVQNVVWQSGGPNHTNTLYFNGSNSVLNGPRDTLLNVSGPLGLKAGLTLQALPTSNSALIAGKTGSYWIELYKDGYMCAFINENLSKANKSACKNTASLIGTRHVYAMSVNTSANVVQLGIDGAIAASTPIAPGGISSGGDYFRVGSAAPSADGFYSSFKGVLDSVDIYKNALAFAAQPTSTPLPTVDPCPKHAVGDANCDGAINLNDFERFRQEYTGLLNTKTSDFTGDGKITLLDFETWRRNF